MGGDVLAQSVSLKLLPLAMQEKHKKIMYVLPSTFEMATLAFDQFASMSSPSTKKGLPVCGATSNQF